MDNVTSKNVKKYILDIENDLDEVIVFLELNFKETVEGIMNALFSLIRNYPQNQTRADYLIDLLERLLDIKTTEELKLLVGPIVDFKNKIEDHWTLKQKLLIHTPYARIEHLLTKINQKVTADIKNNKIKILEYLIFQEQNLFMVEELLNQYPNSLNSKNKEGDNIFTIVLKKYLYLEEKNMEEIDYYYQVLLLFIKGKLGRLILKEKDNYLRIIRQSKLIYKEHIIKVIELLDPEFSITTEKLEEKYGIKFQFPNIILEELMSFMMDSQNRVNFTNQECITIDGKEDKCLDDALFIEKNLDGSYTLYIHITDIPSFIPYQSITNEEAKVRGETLYLRDRKISLYPEYVSDNICSLLPNNNRNVITYIFRLSPDFEVLENSFQIVKGKIRVHHKMSYEEVDNHFSNLTNSSLDQMLIWLYQFSNKRRGENKKKEIYRIYENMIYFEKNHESLKIDQSPSANIVHEAMILVNYSVAKYFKELSLPFIYRKLMMPSNEFMEEQISKIQKLDTKIVQDKNFLYHLRNSYVEATYHDKPVFHTGLKLECYSHSTSPARRYPDSFGQYLIYEFLFLEHLEERNIFIWEYRVKEMVRYLNDKKRSNEVFANQYNYLSYRGLIKSKKREK